MYSDGEERLVCPTKSDRFTLERLVSPSCQLPAQPVCQYCASFSIQNENIYFEIRALILSHMENPRILSLFFLYMKTFSSCMIPFDPSSILYQNAFHKKLRIFPLTSFKWSIFTVCPGKPLLPS
ncbi:hypothetical protein POTOM_000032 [Populus tomentosa]|uniref:Uncharacterized protein n=1 Tax=Populus tomentosa TaxID=118781 RepID=A0A8X8DFB2_POPTO|nr:hypothetical protein POTOM_000032 [Populus tomentosa]